MFVTGLASLVLDVAVHSVNPVLRCCDLLLHPFFDVTTVLHHLEKVCAVVDKLLEIREEHLEIVSPFCVPVAVVMMVVIVLLILLLVLVLFARSASAIFRAFAVFLLVGFHLREIER